MGIVESAPFQMRTKLEAAPELAETVKPPADTAKVVGLNNVAGLKKE
jgi:hypothetical protein